MSDEKRLDGAIDATWKAITALWDADDGRLRAAEVKLWAIHEALELVTYDLGRTAEGVDHVDTSEARQ